MKNFQIALCTCLLVACAGLLLLHTGVEAEEGTVAVDEQATAAVVEIEVEPMEVELMSVGSVGSGDSDGFTPQVVGTCDDQSHNSCIGKAFGASCVENGRSGICSPSYPTDECLCY